MIENFDLLEYGFHPHMPNPHAHTMKYDFGTDDLRDGFVDYYSTNGTIFIAVPPVERPDGKFYPTVCVPVDSIEDINKWLEMLKLPTLEKKYPA